MKRIAEIFICFALGVACLTGCTNADEAFAEKSYKVKGEEVTEIYIDVRDRQIEVVPSPDSQIHIYYFESSKEYYDISVSDNHSLTMTAASDKEWSDYIGGKAAVDARKISLQLPKTLLVRLELSTTNENISLANPTAVNSISLSAQGGSIVFDKLNAGKTISLSAKNGDITGSIIGSYNDYAISCNVKKGESNLPSTKENGTKALTAFNNNGNINIEFASE